MITSIIAENSTNHIKKHVTEEYKKQGFQQGLSLVIREDRV